MANETAPTDTEADEALLAFLERFDTLLDEDPEAALRHVQAAPPELAEEPDVLIAHASAIWEVDGPEAARDELEAWVVEDPAFADAHHLLWSIADEADDLPAKLRHGLRVLELDREADELAGPPPPEDEEFLVEAAEAVLGELPDPFRIKLQNVPILLEPRPDEDVVRDGLDPRALGLFEGPNSEEMTSPESYPAPTRIVLYSHCLLEAFGGDDDALAEEVRVTVLHEIGHYFGLDEAGLARLGLD
jgi:predicted Zn-dependent protease with MMP-like domain